MATHYNTTNYPIFVCNHGHWDIYRNERGYCVCIPTPEGAAAGCKPSHFGDAEYVLATLGIHVAIARQRVHA